MFKKTIAIVLCFALVCSFAAVAYADTLSEADCPYIYVHGFMAKDLIADKNDPDSEILWPPQTDDILELVKEVAPAIVEFLAIRNYDRLADAIIEPCKKALCKANLDENGNAIGDSGVYFKYPDRDTITKTSKLNFNYDWRLDPLQSAAELNDFINYVLDASGAEQVVLECHSFGGVVTETYTSVYGSSKLRSVCYNTSAIFGESYTGELLSGMIDIRAEALTEYLKCLLGQSEYKKLTDGIFDILYDAGVTEDICDLGNDIVENIGEEAIKEVVAPMFSGWLSIWAMIPDEYFDACYEYIFNDVYGDNGADHKGLVEKINSYNISIRPYKTQTLVQQNEEINLYVISRYGYTSVPLVPSWNVMSDSVVDTANSSFGAICAPYNSVLNDTYLESNKDSKYINPDRTIDSSAALFPDQTWFIKGLQHAACPDGLDDLAYDLLYFKGQADIESFDNYPQYLTYDWQNDTIVKSVSEEKTSLSFFDRIIAFFKELIGLPHSIKERIFG